MLGGNWNWNWNWNWVRSRPALTAGRQLTGV